MIESYRIHIDHDRMMIRFLRRANHWFRQDGQDDLTDDGNGADVAVEAHHGAPGCLQIGNFTVKDQHLWLGITVAEPRGDGAG